jgi:uncharacterized surface protein with fasciclin (FAS1) repeats
VSGAGLFVIGTLVTLIVAAAMALLFYAEVLDGRDATARRAAEQQPDGPVGAPNLMDAARGAGDFTTLIEAIDRAGLSELLTYEGPYTIFAPTDRAFAQLPAGTVQSLLAAEDTLTDVLNYHLVAGRMAADEVAQRVRAETVQGEALTISNNGAIRVDGARVLAGGLEASNGVIHVIDRVLLPARM